MNVCHVRLARACSILVRDSRLAEDGQLLLLPGFWQVALVLTWASPQGSFSDVATGFLPSKQVIQVKDNKEKATVPFKIWSQKRTLSHLPYSICQRCKLLITATFQREELVSTSLGEVAVPFSCSLESPEMMFSWDYLIFALKKLSQDLRNTQMTALR